MYASSDEHHQTVMASGTSCISVEPKKDFDLAFVLEAFNNSIITTKSKRLEKFIMQEDNLSDSFCSSLTINQKVQFSKVKKCYSVQTTEFPSADHLDTLPTTSINIDMKSSCQSHDSSTQSASNHRQYVQGRSASAALLFDIDELSLDSESAISSVMRTGNATRLVANPSTISLTSTDGVGIDSGENFQASGRSYIVQEDTSALIKSRKIIVREYLRAFKELTRFFKLTGPVFSFVARDLSNKITTIQTYLETTETGSNITLDVILQQASIGSTHYQAARTILRLHWALEFIVEFMNRLRDAPHTAKASKIAHDVYLLSLAKHHPWLTRKLACIAVHTLPSIKHLIDMMCKQDYEEVLVLLAETVNVGESILSYTTALYSAHNLSNMI